MKEYYGEGFQRSALPEADDLETVVKGDVDTKLADATRHSKRKGKYHKTKHAPDLLGKINSEKVRLRCRHCARMFDTLLNLIQGG